MANDLTTAIAELERISKREPPETRFKTIKQWCEVWNDARAKDGKSPMSYDRVQQFVGELLKTGKMGLGRAVARRLNGSTYTCDGYGFVVGRVKGKK